MTTKPKISRRVARLADTFAGALKAHLTAAQWEEMRDKNASPDYGADACASHDYCDANDVMAAACGVVGVSLTSDAGRKAWNEAWTMAKAAYLTAPLYVVSDNRLGVTVGKPLSRIEAGRMATQATLEASQRGEPVATGSGLDRFTVRRA